MCTLIVLRLVTAPLRVVWKRWNEWVSMAYLQPLKKKYIQKNKGNNIYYSAYKRQRESPFRGIMMNGCVALRRCSWAFRGFRVVSTVTWFECFGRARMNSDIQPSNTSTLLESSRTWELYRWPPWRYLIRIFTAPCLSSYIPASTCPSLARLEPSGWMKRKSHYFTYFCALHYQCYATRHGYTVALSPLQKKPI